MNQKKMRSLILGLVIIVVVLNFSGSCCRSGKYIIIPTNDNPGNPIIKNLDMKFDTQKDLIIVPDCSYRLTYYIHNLDVYEDEESNNPLTFDEFYTYLNELLKGPDITASLVSSRDELMKFYESLKKGRLEFFGNPIMTKNEIRKILSAEDILWKVTLNIWDARRRERPKDSWSSEPRLLALVTDNFVILLHGPQKTLERKTDPLETIEIFLTNPRPRGKIQ